MELVAQAFLGESEEKPSSTQKLWQAGGFGQEL